MQPLVSIVGPMELWSEFISPDWLYPFLPPPLMTRSPSRYDTQILWDLLNSVFAISSTALAMLQGGYSLSTNWTQYWTQISTWRDVPSTKPTTDFQRIRRWSSLSCRSLSVFRRETYWGLGYRFWTWISTFVVWYSQQQQLRRVMMIVTSRVVWTSKVDCGSLATGAFKLACTNVGKEDMQYTDTNHISNLVHFRTEHPPPHVLWCCSLGEVSQRSSPECNEMDLQV